MSASDNFIAEVGILADELERLGLDPILIGGMALVILGSRRVTRDFDFLMTAPGVAVESVVKLFYKHGYELVSRLNDTGDVLRTIDNQRIAVLRIQKDKPEGVFFYRCDNGLKIDLLFDFPLPAHEVAARAESIKIGKYRLRLACREDLIRLKEQAIEKRKQSSDLQDLEFLRRLKTTST